LELEVFTFFCCQLSPKESGYEIVRRFAKLFDSGHTPIPRPQKAESADPENKKNQNMLWKEYASKVTSAMHKVG